MKFRLICEGDTPYVLLLHEFETTSDDMAKQYAMLTIPHICSHRLNTFELWDISKEASRLVDVYTTKMTVTVASTKRG